MEEREPVQSSRGASSCKRAARRHARSCLPGERFQSIMLRGRARSSGDRAFASGAKGRRFESCRAYQNQNFAPFACNPPCASEVNSTP